MSTTATALCLLLIDDVFGELAAQVFEALATHGRLSSSNLGQRTGLTARQLKHALAILIQQNLVVWTTDDNENTFYEAHQRNAYNLVRLGKLTRVIGERYGQIGQSIVTALLLSGHVRVSDMTAALVTEQRRITTAKTAKTNGSSNKEEKAEGGSSNGDSIESEEQTNEIRATIFAMIESGFLIIGHESHFRPQADNQAEAYHLELKLHGEKVKKAEEDAFQQKVTTRLFDWQYNRPARREILEQTGMMQTSIGKRRRNLVEDDIGHVMFSKRRRTDHQSDHGLKSTWNPASVQALSILDNYVLKVNFQKLAVVVRNEKLAELANNRIGKATSLVYEELLDQVGKSLIFCRGLAGPSLDESVDEDFLLEDSDSSTVALTSDISSEVDLSDTGPGIGSAAKDKMNVESIENGDEDIDMKDSTEDVHRGSGKTVTDDLTDEDEDEDGPKKEVSNNASSAKGKTQAAIPRRGEVPSIAGQQYIVRQHLLLLKEYHGRLADVHRTTHRRGESWSVNFPQVSRHLRLQVIESIIKVRFGEPALRLVRIMQEKGKLEQKHLAALCLLNQKLMWSLLTAMHTAGYVDLQEVPKDSTRAPTKTIYLWFFDEAQCALRMLEDIYKAMTRTLERIKTEKERHQSVISKSERSDVVGHEDEMLSGREKAELAAWRRSLNKLMGELGRLDDDVFALRDF